jgi:serine/threonine protein kinase
LHNKGDQGIIHRDLKLDNIFINFPDFKEDEDPYVTDEYLKDFDPDLDRIEVYIADFGLSRELDSFGMAQTF